MVKNSATNIFVYGSLKRGYALHHLIAEQQFLGPAVTEDRYALYDCGDYPGIVKAKFNGVAIRGELYRVRLQCLRQLHEVEGVNEGLYCHEIIKLQKPFSNLQCTAYFYLRSTENLKNCGREWPAESRPTDI